MLAIYWLETKLVPANQQDKMAQNRTAGSTILIVEDEILIRMDAADYFADEGFNVLEAGSADAALLFLESRGDFDYVFSDVNMPGTLDGLALGREVTERWPHIGVVITSGMVRPVRSSLPAGTIFVEKPYEYRRLLESLLHLDVDAR
jgi:DNA-binding NtrC family response regulator